VQCDRRAWDAALIAALDAIADELESSARPIDNANRRHALRAWTIPPDDGDGLATQLRAVRG